MKNTYVHSSLSIENTNCLQENSFFLDYSCGFWLFFLSDFFDSMLQRFLYVFQIYSQWSGKLCKINQAIIPKNMVEVLKQSVLKEDFSVCIKNL